MNLSLREVRPRHRAGAALLLASWLVAAACGPQAPPIDETAQMDAARRALAGGNADEADRLLAALLEARPEHVDALLARAKLHAHEGRLAAAADLYVRLTELRPDNGVYALQAGSYLESSGRVRDAAGHLQRAAALRPRDPDAHYRLGTHHFTAGDFLEALAALQAAHAGAVDRADIGIKLAQTLEQLDRSDEAVAVLDGVLQADDTDPFLRFVRGLMLSRAGRHDAAIVDLSFAAEHDPELHRARYALARALLAAGHEARGTAEMERFIAEDERRRQDTVARHIANVAGASSDDSPALFRQRMEGLVLSDPTSAEANRQLAIAYAREGDYQQAERTYARAARLDAADARSRRERGRLLIRLGRAGEAVPVLEEAAALTPEDELIGRLLSRARREAGG